MTIYDFAKLLMEDKEFNNGGIIPNEKKYLDEIGLDYKEKNGIIIESGVDLTKFYSAMSVLQKLNKKYLEIEDNSKK